CSTSPAASSIRSNYVRKRYATDSTSCFPGETFALQITGGEDAMNTTIIRMSLAALLVLGFTTIGNAQTRDINGTVQRVDASSSTVYLTDGRAVQLAPGTRLYVGGREVRLADVQPGWVFSSGTSATTGTVITPSAGTVITPTPLTAGTIATPST